MPARRDPLEAGPAEDLAAARAEVERLRAEVARLRIRLAEVGGDDDASEPAKDAPSGGSVTAASAPDEKVALFLSLFRGREDVYALRWEGRSGKSGYSPACANEWRPGLCGKPQVHCADCKNQALRPLSAEVASLHLQGKLTAGTYAMRRDETCTFLAADFDRTTWVSDAKAFLEACDEFGVPAYLERSRSGQGGHVWIFFDRPVPALLARSLGSAILTRAMDVRPEVGFASYDRFFPS